MDFIRIRKEITSELRTIDAKLKSQGVKVGKRDLGKTTWENNIKVSKSNYVPLRFLDNNLSLQQPSAHTLA
jgi:hypothetical protein